MEMMISLIASTLRISTPLTFAAMGGLMSERSGIIHIALEGIMLVSAFFGAAVAHLYHSPILGACAGVAAGIIFASLYAFVVIVGKADQIVAGTAMNLLAFGLTPLLCKILFDSTGASPALEFEDRFQIAPMLWSVAAVVMIHIFFKYTTWGLRISVAGEKPESLLTAGVSVKKIRWGTVIASGALAGLAGVSLSIFLSSSFSRGMTAGRGFMALAALIFGKWKPLPTFVACLFFAFTDALQIRLQGVSLFGGEPIPVQFIQVLPYAFTVFALAGFVGRSRAPKALGNALSIGFLTLGLMGLSGCFLDRFIKKPEPAPVVSSSPHDAQALSQIYNEMIEVVFEQSPQNKSDFFEKVGALTQGATLEGLFNGLTHSAFYRSYESQSSVVTPKELQFFANEFAEIQLSLKEPVEISESLRNPMGDVQFPTGEEKSDSDSGVSAMITIAGKSKQALALEFQTFFQQSRHAVLKRVLSDAMMQKIDESIKNPKDFEAWYGAFCQRYAHLGVDFGLKLRNQNNPEFHVQWLQGLNRMWGADTARDRVVWEVLNRVHRVMNSYQKESV